MKAVVLAGLALLLTGAAQAQSQGQSRDRGNGVGTRASSSMRGEGLPSGMSNLRGDLLQPGQAAAPASRQRPPRPEKAYGPDLVAPVLAPIGPVVEAIAQGLRAFDTAIAPVNEALLPLTGPLDPAPFQPAPEAAPPPAAGPAAVPPAAGPRK